MLDIVERLVQRGNVNNNNSTTTTTTTITTTTQSIQSYSYLRMDGSTSIGKRQVTNF